VGRETQEDSISARDPNQRRGAIKAMPSPTELLAKLELPPVSETKDKSVFLAKSGIDARVAKFQEKEIHESRLVTRRNAVVVTSHMSGETRKLRLAPKIFSKRHPDRFQYLQKLCEHKIGKAGPIYTELNKTKEQMKDLCVKAGATEQEVEQLFQAFKQHDFDADGALDLEEIRSVLADMGLQPQNREEKSEVFECMAERESRVGDAFAFPDFLELVKLVRERLRGLQSMQCMLIFHEADEDRSESLDWEEVMTILDSKLTLQPRTDEERQEVHNIFDKCDVDSDGALSFDDFQNFVQRTRSKLLTMRRQEEINIAMEFRLSSAIIREFRVDLPLLYKVYKRYSKGHEETGVAVENLLALLVELGVAPREANSTVLQIVMTVVADISNIASNEFITFPGMLNVIRQARCRCKDMLSEELTDRFHQYDRSNSGTLVMNEIYQILEEFRMLPRTKEEQYEVGRCIESFDHDGSGTFELGEFHDFFQRMTEQMRFAERQREYAVAVSLGIDDARFAVIRRSFIALKPNMDGNVPLIAVSQMMMKLRHKLELGLIAEDDMRLLNRRGQEAPQQLVSFIFFLHQVKHCLLDAVVAETEVADEESDQRRRPVERRLQEAT